MEKKKYDLCLEVLRRLKIQGILDRILLAGSWCVLFYENYFKDRGILPVLRTRDIEFLFPIPFNFRQEIDLYKLLKDLGFVLDYKGEHGYIVFQHPDLILEFLVPARGRASGKPFPITQLGINAQPLRFMDVLSRNPIQMLFGDVTVSLPHPVDFALHKLLIAGRRKRKYKAEKDREQAVALLNALNTAGDFRTVRKVYSAMPKSWKKTIRQELLALDENRLLGLIEKARE